MTNRTNRSLIVNSFTDKAKYRGLFATSCLVGLAMAVNTQVKAAPTGGNVVGGSANINVNGKQTNITQSSDRAVINWNSFSVNRDESVNFSVPNNGATLNRVVGFDPSLIQGTISSNGTLYLVNPNGLSFDVNSQVTAQNFIASTADISTNSFMAGGKLNFNQASNTKNSKITLKGTIATPDRGIVGIFAPQIDNQGTITANLGTVALGGTNTQIIDFNGDGLMNFELGAADALFADSVAVTNKGSINAAGGHIVMSARGARNLVNGLVSNNGDLSAKSLTAKGGSVELRAEQGTVTVDGSMDASGANGGGTITIGGDFHGANSARASNGQVGNADLVSIGRNARINADAINSGNGGTVAIWSDGHTNYLGDISALGGANSGNGGFVEVSGKRTLNFRGTVSTLAANGKAGTLLLDPSDITISSTTDADMSGTSTPFSGTAATSILSKVTLEAALAGGNVVVDATSGTGASTTSKITVAAGTSIDWTQNNSLTLTAGSGGIVINGTLNGSGATSAVILSTTGTISRGANGAINANSLSITASGAVSVSGAITTISNYTNNAANSAVTIASTNALTIGAAINAGTANVSLNASGAITQTAAITAGILTATSTNDNVTLDHVGNMLAGLGTISGKNVTIKNARSLTLNGNITANGVLGTAGRIFISTANGGAGNRDITMNSIVTLTSGNASMVLHNTQLNIIFDLGGTGGAIVGGTFRSNFKTLFAANYNILILAGGFALDQATGNDVSPIGSAIEAGTGKVLTFTPVAPITGNNLVVTSADFLNTNPYGTSAARGADIPLNRVRATGNPQFSSRLVIDSTGTLTVTGATSALTDLVTLKASGNISFTGSASNFAGSLKVESTGGTISIGSELNLGANDLTLLSAGAITQTAAITAGTLAATATGFAVTLNTATNMITNLGAVTANSLAFKNGQALTVTGAIAAGSGSVNLDVTGALAVNNTVTTSGSVSFTATGTITQSNIAVISAGTLAATATGFAVTLNTATNRIANLGAVTATSFSFKNGQALTLNGSIAATTTNIQTTAGAITISSAQVSAGTLTLNSAGAIAINAAIGATTSNLSLTSAGTITQTAAITAATLTATATGDLMLTNTGNEVTSLAEITARHVYITNSKSLILNGNITANGNAFRAATDIWVTPALDKIDAEAGRIFISTKEGATTADRNITWVPM